VKDCEQDYPDHTQTPGWAHGDERLSNTSASPTFHDAIDQVTPSRRGLLAGGLAAPVARV
jgi:hypothetical protein